MTTTLPCIRGHFGSTEYFVVTMPAAQLEKLLTIPKELDGWEDFNLEERFQREVNFKRVKEHIAPYLANDEDRFFGAFIVDIYNAEEAGFEPLSSVIKGRDAVPRHYQKGVEEFGFLFLAGNEIFVPLDGQHRLTAIKFAISGKDEKGKEIPGLTPSTAVGSDICTCIMIKHDKDKARKIFNKVNRYAKPTSKSDNLITADDDIVAVITRDLVKKHFDDRIVNYSSNTLTKSSIEFTTLSVLYEATAKVLESSGFGINQKINRMALPDQATQRVLKTNADKFWESFVEKIEIFNAPLHDPSDSGDEKRIAFREDYVLGKPILQLALVEAITRLKEGGSLSEDIIYERINGCDWKVDNPLWQRVLMNGDKVVTGTQAQKFASRYISYLLGEELEEPEINTLQKQYAELFDAAGKTLPPRLV